MRDYEKLVKSLRENAEWADGNIWEVPIMLPDNLRQAADAIEELVSSADKFKWISTAERQPEKSGLYLTYNPRRSFMTMHYSAKNKAWNAFDHEDEPKYALEVTHWMPLPSTEGLNET